jgi:VIT1/CCC1 family predicted Fe2+/Mn2+ transporter
MVLTLALWGTLHGLVQSTLSETAGAAASMAGGQYLSDKSSSSLKRAIIMGVATFIGGIFPAIPFYFSRQWPAFAVCGVIVMCIGMLIVWLREDQGVESYIKTFGVLFLATVIGLGTGALAP